MVEKETKENVTKKSTWLRFLYMILFAVIFNIAEFAVVVVVVVQFITKLFTGDVHARLQEFGDSVALYLAEIVRYLTFTADDLPYPFGEWPKGQAPRRRRRKKKAESEQAAAKPETPAENASPDAPPSATPGTPSGTPPGSSSGSGGPASG